MQKTIINITITISIFGILFTGCSTKSEVETQKEKDAKSRAWSKQYIEKYYKNYRYNKALKQVGQRSYNKAYYGR